MVVDQGHSSFTAVTRHSGLLGFLGHDHGVVATRWTASVSFKPGDSKPSDVDVVVEGDSLMVDTLEGRQLAGLNANGPDQEDRDKIKKNMFGPDVLDIKHYPQIRFKSLSSKMGAVGINMVGNFSLHGITRVITVPIVLKSEKNGSVEFTGAFHFLMSDYGIHPPSVAGVVNVKDEMEIRFIVKSQ